MINIELLMLLAEATMCTVWADKEYVVVCLVTNSLPLLCFSLQVSVVPSFELGSLECCECGNQLIGTPLVTSWR